MMLLQFQNLNLYFVEYDRKVTTKEELPRNWKESIVEYLKVISVFRLTRQRRVTKASLVHESFQFLIPENWAVSDKYFKENIHKDCSFRWNDYIFPEVYCILCRTSAVKLVKSISNSVVGSRSCSASCMRLKSAESFTCLLQVLLAFTALLDRQQRRRCR
jgi:hypothetical protein